MGAKPILSLAFVAKLLLVPFEKARWMVRQHFAKKREGMYRVSIQPPKLNPKELHVSERVTLERITEEERNYICNQDTLHEQAHLSLKDRSKLFHRQFPNRVIRPWEYSRVMKWNGIRQKKVKTKNMPQKKDKLYKKYAD